MTRQHNQQIHCPSCGVMITHETAFGRWIRNNRKIDSADGFCVVDQDYWIHRFRTYENREFQLLMMVEIKTWGAQLSMAQRDTLHIINQVTRNRRQTPTKENRYQAGTAPLRVYSAMNKREINLRVFGAHVLTFSGLGPADSESITWDGKSVDLDTLTSLLRFDIDPDTLKPLDLRNHHITAFNSVMHLPLLDEAV